MNLEILWTVSTSSLLTWIIGIPNPFAPSQQYLVDLESYILVVYPI